MTEQPWSEEVAWVVARVLAAQADETDPDDAAFYRDDAAVALAALNSAGFVVVPRAQFPQVDPVRRDDRGQLWIGGEMWDDDGTRAARKLDIAERLAVDAYLDAHPYETEDEDDA